MNLQSSCESSTIESALRSRPAADWLAGMAHLPAGGVRTIDQALQAPEVLEREMVRHIEEDEGIVSVLGTPFKFTDQTMAPFRSPPLLGQHTDDVLRTVLGLGDDEVTALRDAGTVR